MTSCEPETIKVLMLSIIERSALGGLEDREVPDDFNLLAEGLIDSLGFVELIAELEDRLGIQIDLAELDPDELAVVGPLSRQIATNCRNSTALPKRVD